MSRTTITSYTEYIQEVLFSHKVRRNDLIIKMELKTEEKYYLTDHGFHHILIDDNKKMDSQNIGKHNIHGTLKKRIHSSRRKNKK